MAHCDLEFWDREYGTFELWDLGTLGPWVFGTMEPWDIGTSRQLNVFSIIFKVFAGLSRFCKGEHTFKRFLQGYWKV